MPAVAAKQQLLQPAVSPQAAADASAAASRPVDGPGGVNSAEDYEPDDRWAAVVHDNFKDPALWVGLTTRSGIGGDLAVAAFQKEIRRGGENSENALKLCYELCMTSAGAEDKVWQRLLVIAAEDIGAGDPHKVPSDRPLRNGRFS